MIIIELFSHQKPVMRIFRLGASNQRKKRLVLTKNADLQNIARSLWIYRYKGLFLVPSMF